LGIVLIGLLLKLIAGRASLTDNGILFPGYDELYHMRRILYTVNNFPHTLWFDSYLNYPHGLNITWPPLFDLISAALSLALGQHTQGGIEMASAFVPVIIGIMAIVVVYLLVKELFDSKVALLAGFMTALAPYYLLYTMFAATDHHCLEVLLQLCSLLFITMAIIRRDRMYMFAALAGISMAALAYTWQGADVYLGIFLIFAAVKMTIDLKDGVSSQETAAILLIAYGVALILVLPFWSTVWLSPSFLGLAAMIIALAIMYALSRFLANRKLPWQAFPLCLVVLIVVFAFLVQLLGGLFGLGPLIHYGFDYLWGGKMIGKIGEAEPLIYDAETFYAVVFSGLGLNLLFSLAGIAASIMYIRSAEGDKKQGQLLLLVWAILALLLTFGQSRFLYLSTITMGVLISILFFQGLQLVERFMNDRKQESPKVLAVILFLILVLPTLADAISFAQSTPPAVAGDWDQSLVWLKDNSNATSFYDRPENVPEYSVMSWWDYGNWILYLAKRPVVANNFQAGWEDAARFYLSESEERATAVLNARGSKYILTDYNLIYGKLPALITWAREDLSSYIKYEDYGSQVAALPTQRLFNTTIARLYFFDGAGTGHFRLIYESATFMGDRPPKSMVKIFEYVPGALIRIKTDSDQRVYALLNMTSNQKRTFTYVNEAVPKDDVLEIRVPYSTERRYETHALNPYLIFSGSEAGVKTQNLNVSEQDVLEGRTIEVTI